MRATRFPSIIAAYTFVAAVSAACASGAQPAGPPTPSPIPTSMLALLYDGRSEGLDNAEATPSWEFVLQRTPYPFTRELPPPEPTVLDGMYSKVEVLEATPSPCIRCPDYRIVGGVWRLNLERGVFRIYSDTSGWRDVASYEVKGERLELFNDPTCMDTVGVYAWSLADEQLSLRAIEDDCAPGLRPRNLGHMPWSSCDPPNREAAVSDHWKRPPGC